MAEQTQAEMAGLDLQEREVEQVLGRAGDLVEEIGRRIVGQHEAIREVLLCLLAGGHGLLEGVPGLAKTLLVRSLAEAVDVEFRRVQFTPDLMPGDILGTEVIEEDRSTGRRVPRFIRGPVFTNVLLADEINRAPPKTQAALLEAMQEARVTIAGEELELEQPFFVLATQNPIEHEGTYPLPEAQLDRFLLQIRVDYPDEADELDILRSTTGTDDIELRAVLDAAGVTTLQRMSREVPAADNVVRYAAALVRATRPGRPGAEDDVTRWLRWGASPRAGQSMILCAKANALLEGRLHVDTSDIRRVAAPALRHRILPTFHAEAEGVTTDDLIDTLLDRVRPPASGL